MDEARTWNICGVQCCGTLGVRANIRRSAIALRCDSARALTRRITTKPQTMSEHVGQRIEMRTSNALLSAETVTGGAIVKTCGSWVGVGVGEVSKELGDVVVPDQAGGAGRGLPCVVRVPRVSSVAA